MQEAKQVTSSQYPGDGLIRPSMILQPAPLQVLLTVGTWEPHRICYVVSGDQLNDELCLSTSIKGQSGAFKKIPTEDVG